MVSVKQKVFKNSVIELDGVHFSDCKFTDCIFIYRGRGASSMTGCIHKRTKLVLKDGAAHTYGLLRAAAEYGWQMPMPPRQTVKRAERVKVH